MKTFGMSVEYYKLCRHPVFCYYNRKERVENMPKNIAVITGAAVDSDANLYVFLQRMIRFRKSGQWPEKKIN